MCISDNNSSVLNWLCSDAGHVAQAESGAAFPEAVGAQHSYVDFWTEQGVDVTALQEATQAESIPAPVGPNIQAGFGEIGPFFEEMFQGRLPVAEALAQAQAAGNTAING